MASHLKRVARQTVAAWLLLTAVFPSPKGLGEAACLRQTDGWGRDRRLRCSGGLVKEAIVKDPEAAKQAVRAYCLPWKYPSEQLIV